MGRDPIEEDGGINLYGFVGNEPVGGWDELGTEEGAEETCCRLNVAKTGCTGTCEGKIFTQCLLKIFKPSLRRRSHGYTFPNQRRRKKGKLTFLVYCACANPEVGQEDADLSKIPKDSFRSGLPNVASKSLFILKNLTARDALGFV